MKKIWFKKEESFLSSTSCMTMSTTTADPVFALPSRGACEHCRCDATAFSSPWRNSPTHVNEPCSCGHPYSQHQLIELTIQPTVTHPAPHDAILAAIARSPPSLAHGNHAPGGGSNVSNDNDLQVWVATPVASGSVQQQRTASSSRHRSANRRPPQQAPVAAPIPETHLTFTVALWPFVVCIHL